MKQSGNIVSLSSLFRTMTPSTCSHSFLFKCFIHATIHFLALKLALWITSLPVPSSIIWNRLQSEQNKICVSESSRNAANVREFILNCMIFAAFFFNPTLFECVQHANQLSGSEAAWMAKTNTAFADASHRIDVALKHCANSATIHSCIIRTSYVYILYYCRHADNNNMLACSSRVIASTIHAVKHALLSPLRLFAYYIAVYVRSANDVFVWMTWNSHRIGIRHPLARWRCMHIGKSCYHKLIIIIW